MNGGRIEFEQAPQLQNGRVIDCLADYVRVIEPEILRFVLNQESTGSERVVSVMEFQSKFGTG